MSVRDLRSGRDVLRQSAPVLFETRDRLHTDGTRAVYPTFVNLGDKPLVSGDGLLLQVRFRLLKDGAAAPEVRDAVTVSPALEYRYMTIE